MFSPVPMLQLSALVLERDQHAVLRELGALGAMQLTATPAGPETAPLPPRDRSEEVSRCDGLLARVGELRRSFVLPARPAGPADMTLDQADAALRAVEQRAGALLDRRRQLVQRQGELTATGEQMSSYRGLAVPLDQLGRFSFLHFVTGSIPPENLGPLQEGVRANMVLLPMPERADRQPLIALSSRAGRADLDLLLQRAGFRAEALPALAGATAETLAESSKLESARTTVELAQLDRDLQACAAASARALDEIEETARTERRLLEAGKHFPRTQAAVLIRGWVPAAGAAALEQRLRTITGGRCALTSAAPSDVPEGQIPVLLRHGRLLRPFEMLVSGYGLPMYRELSPTLFVAISYLLMFGMMFGDVGHGAVLAIAGGIMLFRARATRARDAGLLLTLGGLTSAVFGAIYGSCFGIERLKHFALWRDPLEGDPMNLMYVAMGIGVVMISLGLVLNCINGFRRRQWLGACLGKFGAAGLLFYWGALLLLFNFTPLQSRGLALPAALLLVALPVLGWIMKAPIDYVRRCDAGRPVRPGPLLIVMTESLVEAFEGALLYLANTISFVRLAAYAMSHAALMLAIALLAVEVNRLCAHGRLPGLLVLIGGNAAAIALEAVIASVQALRLEYYEFFGKFFSGSGQPFEPFCLTGPAPAQAG